MTLQLEFRRPKQERDMLLQGQYLTSTIRIKHVGGTGSAVIVSVRGTGYLVTACHLVSGIQSGENVLFRVDDSWANLTVTHTNLGENDDIAVLRCAQLGDQGLGEEFVSGSLIVGQPVVYCGFPLGLEGMAPEGHRWPIPLVKAAIYSGSISRDGRMIHLFDSINNKGFSGGPIFAQEAGIPKLAAIVSGYHFDRPLEVMRRSEVGEFEAVPDLAVQPNSGFMKAVPIKRALELIADMERTA